MKLMDKAKQAALAAAVKTGLGYLEKDPEVNIPKLMELVDKFVPDAKKRWKRAIFTTPCAAGGHRQTHTT